MPVVWGGMLITLTRHFLFYTLFNVLAGVSSSAIWSPDNILKYQRIQVFFWSGMPCVFSSKDSAAGGGKVSCSRRNARGDFQQCSDTALPLHAAFCSAAALLECRALCFLLAWIWEGASVKKTRKWNIYSGASILALLKFHVFSSWCCVFFRFLFPGTCAASVCTLRKGSPEECWLCWEMYQREKTKPTVYIKQDREKYNHC